MRGRKKKTAGTAAATSAEAQRSTLYIPAADLLRLSAAPAVFWLCACRSCARYVLAMHLLELGPAFVRLAVHLAAAPAIF